jgi:hypothetical protein
MDEIYAGILTLNAMTIYKLYETGPMILTSRILRNSSLVQRQLGIIGKE